MKSLRFTKDEVLWYSLYNVVAVSYIETDKYTLQPQILTFQD